MEIRQMEARDVDAVVRIDGQISGRPRNEILRRRLGLALAPGRVTTSLVAESDRQVVGFILGDVLVGEFGATAQVATIDTIGVSPLFQGSGVAWRLLRAYANHVRALGVERIQTLVPVEDWRLLRFFTRAGFGQSQLLPLALDLSGIQAGQWLDSDEDDAPCARNP
ncbi:MAG: GNAT family N-acetyltransferase [Myxococcales bacterium]|nr:GNAT family N-acetyltransferase [Myxococcales bacterium]